MKNDRVSEPEDKLAYQVNEFCSLIGISRSTFYDFVKAGKIRTIQFGTRRLVPVDEARRLAREGVQ